MPGALLHGARVGNGYPRADALENGKGNGNGNG